MERKKYINNLRWFTTLLLIPYHTACVYRTPNRGFFVMFQNKYSMIFENVVFVLAVWMMPMLFALAGASTYYALEKRNLAEYTCERFKRLMIPLMISTVILAPMQMYHGNVTYHMTSRTYGFLKSLVPFFSAKTRGGYTGGFDYVGFWFIRHLFFMSLIIMPFIWLYRKYGDSFKETVAKVPLAGIVLLGILPAEGFMVNRSDYGFYEYGMFFILGAFILTNEKVIEKCKKYCWLLLGILLACTYFVCVSRGGIKWQGKIKQWDQTVVYCLLYRFVRWEALLALTGIFARYFNGENKVSRYLTESSYGYYIFHQTIVILVADLVINKYKKFFHGNGMIMYWVTVGASLILTFAAYEIVHRIPVLRAWIGYKPKPKKEAKAEALPEGEAKA